jgi:hypothetical protein
VWRYYLVEVTAKGGVWRFVLAQNFGFHRLWLA